LPPSQWCMGMSGHLLKVVKVLEQESKTI
jgi:hypothetical protein